MLSYSPSTFTPNFYQYCKKSKYPLMIEYKMRLFVVDELQRMVTTVVTTVEFTYGLDSVSASIPRLSLTFHI